jgi:hypothetical protein
VKRGLPHPPPNKSDPATLWFERGKTLAGRKRGSIRALGGAVESRRYGNIGWNSGDAELPNLEYVDLRTSGWKVVGERWFSQLENLIRVELPLEVEVISDSAFTGDIALAEIWFPEGLRELGQDAFSWCCPLKEVSFPPKFERLNECSFSWCVLLRSVVLPATIKRIGPNAFYACRSLKTLTVGDVEEWEVESREKGSALGSDGIVKLRELRLIGRRWETLPVDDLAYCLAPDARVVGVNFLGRKMKWYERKEWNVIEEGVIVVQSK